MNLINRDSVSRLGPWHAYRKKAATQAVKFEATAPTDVLTKEGEYSLPTGWKGFIAIDADGDVYPVEASVFERTHEPLLGERA